MAKTFNAATPAKAAVESWSKAAASHDAARGVMAMEHGIRTWFQPETLW